MSALLKVLAAPSLLISLASETSPPQICPPVPLIIQTPTMAPNSTYISDAEPPKRFSHAPKRPLNIVFGEANVAELCGRPPCGKVFLGCTRDDVMVLPDPFTTDSQEFARIVRHEIGHANGWPATHGL